MNILATKIYNNAQLFFESIHPHPDDFQQGKEWEQKWLTLSPHLAESISLDWRSSIICWNSCREEHLSNSFCPNDGEDDS
jgi:hypothetical protein